MSMLMVAPPAMALPATASQAAASSGSIGTKPPSCSTLDAIRQRGDQAIPGEGTLGAAFEHVAGLHLVVEGDDRLGGGRIDALLDQHLDAGLGERRQQHVAKLVAC